MVPAEHHRGHLPPGASRVTLVPLEAHSPSFSCPLVSRASRVRGRRFLSASQCQDESRGEKAAFCSTACTQNPLQPSLFLLPIAFWAPASWPFSATLHHRVSWEEGLSSQTDPAWGGQDGTTSFSKLAPSWSIELCYLFDQASSVTSPLWKPPVYPTLCCFLPPLPPTRLLVGLGAASVPCGRQVGASLCHSPKWLHLLLCAWGGGRLRPLCMALSHRQALYRQYHTALATPARSRVLHGACLVLMPPSPLPSSPFLGRPGLSVTWEAFSPTPGSSLITLSFYTTRADTFSTVVKS